MTKEEKQIKNEERREIFYWEEDGFNSLSIFSSSSKGIFLCSEVSI